MSETQARRTWSRPQGVLGELIAAAERRVESLGRADAPDRHDTWPNAAVSARRFADALRGPSVAVIAEVKRRSPSKGTLSDTLDAAPRAVSYVAGGAAAISVLTEPDRFGGSLDDLRAVSAAVDRPVLRKDFIVDRRQLLEAARYGASAILLIARALEPGRAEDLAAYASTLGLGVLYEVRDEAELAHAVDVRDCVIGVNTRNLESLAIDPMVGARLLPLVPADRVAVYESGIAMRRDVERAAAFGADAVLVGSVLSPHRDGAGAVRELAGVPRATRG